MKTKLTTVEAAPKMTPAERHIACVTAQRAAIAAGFTTPILVNRPGYWTAVHAFCAANGIPYPSNRAPKAPAPVAPKVEPPAPAPAPKVVAAPIETKREATLRKKREAEKARRARLAAAKGGSRR